MMTIIGIIWDFIKALCGMGQKSDVATALKTGEKLGESESGNSNAQGALREVQQAVDARDSNSAALASDPDRLLDGSDPAARKYDAKPG